MLVPLLEAIRGTRPKGGFLTGWLCGTLVHLVGFPWIIETVQHYSNLNIYLSFLTWILFSIYSGLSFGAVTFLFRLTALRVPVPAAVTFPVFYTAMEYLFPFIFPWHLGALQYDILPIIQICDIFGIYGITALLALVNVCLWEVFSFLKKERSFPVFPCCSALVLVVATIAYGYLRMDNVRSHMEQATKVKPGLVQANVLIEERRSYLLRSDIWKRYERLSAQAISEGAQIIFWPESAVGFPYRPGGHPSSRSTTLRRLVSSLGRPLLFGSWSMGNENPRNTAYFLGPQGTEIGEYHKVRLLAFGEYIPFADYVPQIKGLVQGIGDFEPGESVEPLCWEETCFGVLICYEAILDGLSRDFVNKGAKFLVNITNDVWFGDTNCPEQHLMLASFRAVENRVWLIRAANTGISAFVDPMGRIVIRTPVYEQAERAHPIELMDMPCLYKAWGDWFPATSSILSALLLLAAISTGIRQRRGSPHSP